MKTSIALLLLSGIFSNAPAAEPKTIRAELQPLTARKPAPGFHLDDVNRKRVTNADFHGKVVLLDFWATECGGCRQEIPSFISLQKAYGGKGLRAVGISMDIAYEDLKSAAEAWARVNPFVHENGVNYAILMGDDAVTKAYDIRAMPATYLIDKSGRIAATYIGVVNSDDVEANIKKLLRE
jgi:thiol-disulfide isomerase/thioredoxin